MRMTSTRRWRPRGPTLSNCYGNSRATQTRASLTKPEKYCDATHRVCRRSSRRTVSLNSDGGKGTGEMTPHPKVVEDKDTELRDELRHLISQRDTAKTRRDKTADAVERAQKFVAQLEGHLAKYADVSDRIGRSRAEAFRKSLIDGAALPMLSLSSELTKASAERLDCENQLSAARDAQASLTAELDAENAELDVLEKDTKACAKKVIANYGDILATTLARMEQEAGDLRRRLLGLTQMRSPDIGPYPTSSETVMLLRGSANVATNASGEDVQFWDEWLRRLVVNADVRPMET
jgi:hypothetical protein